MSCVNKSSNRSVVYDAASTTAGGHITQRLSSGVTTVTATNSPVTAANGGVTVTESNQTTTQPPTGVYKCPLLLSLVLGSLTEKMACYRLQLKIRRQQVIFTQKHLVQFVGLDFLN